MVGFEDYTALTTIRHAEFHCSSGNLWSAHINFPVLHVRSNTSTRLGHVYNSLIHFPIIIIVFETPGYLPDFPDLTNYEDKRGLDVYSFITAPTVLWLDFSVIFSF